MKYLLSLIALFGFAGVAYALPYYQQTAGLVPGVNDVYYIGTSTPGTLEYRGIYTKDLTVSGTCTGCGVPSFPLSIANGGTASSSAVTNGVYYYNGTNAEADSLLTFNGTSLGVASSTPGIFTNSVSALAVSGGPVAVQAGNNPVALYLQRNNATGSNTAIGINNRAGSTVYFGNNALGNFGLRFGNSAIDASAAFIIASSTGNVGIGTTTPGSLLSVGTSPTQVANFSSATSTIYGDLVAKHYLLVSSTTPNYAWVPNYTADFGGTANDFLSVNAFNTANGICSTADFTVNNDAATVLFNYGDLGHTSSAFTGVGCANEPYTGFGGNSTHLLDPNGNINFALGSTTAPAHFAWFGGGYAASNILAVLTVGGNFGIGTTTPQRKLHVADAGNLRSQVLIEDTTATANNHYIGIQNTNGALNLNGTNDVLATTTYATIQSASTPTLGVGTTTPWATISAVGDATNPVLAIAATSSSALPNFEIDKAGHPIYSGPKPTCDANCTFVAGNDARFRVKTGTTITSTTVTFANAWGLAPICLSEEGDAGTVVAEASSTPTTVVITIASALTGKDIEVMCDGIQ